MADSDKIITITPNTSVATTHPEIKFVGKDDSPMYLRVLDDNTLSFEGTEGQVFSMSPTMSSGDIFSVNDISGIQSIVVNADGTVALAPVSGNVGIGTTSPDATLEIEHDDSNTDPAFKVTIIDTDSTADSTPFVVSNIGRVGIGTASPLADMALTLNGDGTSYEGIGWQVGGSLKWRQYCDGTSMYMDSRSNGYDLTIRMQDGSGNLRPAMQFDGTTKGVTIGNDGGSDSSVVNMNKLQVNLDGGDKSDGILIVSNSTDVSANDMIGGIGFDTRHGNVPSQVTEASAAIVAYAAEAHATTDKGGYLSFLLSAINDDHDTTSKEKVRIASSSASTSTTMTLYNGNTSMPSDTLYGSIQFYNADSSGAGVGATIDALSNGSGRGGWLQFRTDANGSGSPTVAMSIDENGGVGIGSAEGGIAPTFASGSGLHIYNSTQANLRLEDAAGEYFDVAMQNGDAYLINRVSDGKLQFWTNGTERMEIAAGGAITFNDAFTFPTADGSADQVLVTNGSGTLSWEAAGGVSLANGVNNRIVTATGAAGLNGEANLTFDGTTLTCANITMGNIKLRSTNEIETDSGNIHLQYNTGNHVNIGYASSDSALNMWGPLTLTGQLKSHRLEVLTATVGLILTEAQSGAKVVWAGGSLTLPADPPVGSHYQVFNVTNIDMTITYGVGDGSHSGLSSGAVPVVKREGSLNFIYVGSNDWIYTK
jgi:hypothetical protein